MAHYENYSRWLSHFPEERIVMGNSIVSLAIEWLALHPIAAGYIIHYLSIIFCFLCIILSMMIDFNNPLLVILIIFLVFHVIWFMLLWYVMHVLRFTLHKCCNLFISDLQCWNSKLFTFCATIKSIDESVKFGEFIALNTEEISLDAVYEVFTAEKHLSSYIRNEMNYVVLKQHPIPDIEELVQSESYINSRISQLNNYVSLYNTTVKSYLYSYVSVTLRYSSMPLFEYHPIFIKEAKQ